MKYLKYILTITATLLLLIFLTIRIYFRQDIPQYSGTQPLSSLKDTVEVFTDSYGVPYIFAKNNEDLFFTSGYLIARERLFQLSLYSSIMRGEISNLLGEEYLDHDKYIKQNDIFSIDNENYSIIDDENIKLIEAYCLGVNTWIDEIGGSLPTSFKKLNAKPVKWKTSDAINILNLMTNNRMRQRSKFYIQKMIKQYFGETRYSELIDTEDEQVLSIDSLSVDNLKLENEILALIGASGSPVGSDAMIFSGSRTLSQKPILFFDDIWGLQQPAKWYDVHLNGVDFNIEGSLIPGFPLPLVGKSDDAAWAFSGELRVDHINYIFDLAKNSTDAVRTTKEDKSISYADTSGYYFDSEAHSKRFNLLKEELLKKEVIQVEDILNAFTKTKNHRKTDIAHRIINIYEENRSISNKSIEILVWWNGEDSSISTELLLFNAIYSRLTENIFEDEMQLIGDDIYKMFNNITDFAQTSVINILSNPKSSWIDDISTNNYQETLSDIIIKSVDGALVELITKYGNNKANWQLDNTNRQKSNMVMHKIYDLSDISTGYSNSPTNRSGWQNSPHYSEQSRSNNNFIKIISDDDTIRNSNKYQKLILYPVE